MEVAKFQRSSAFDQAFLDSCGLIDRLIGSGREPMLLLDLYPKTLTA